MIDDPTDQFSLVNQSLGHDLTYGFIIIITLYLTCIHYKLIFVQDIF